MDRRKFIEITAALAGTGYFLQSCSKNKKFKGSIVGSSSSIGHMLRDKNLSKPTETYKKQVVIIGAGISGLTAGRQLFKNGVSDFIIFDLEKEAGGNSSYGSNSVSAYPWGAHYIPIPNNELKDYLDFLEESDIITGKGDQGMPIYNEQYLCFDPQERLYINGRWQDGIVPHFGVPENEQKQIARFLELMEEYRYKKGSDGRYAFAIPVDQSSKDEIFINLDNITMQQWMIQHDFTSSYLHWYINYCTRDDFGTAHKDISAWMGIHYFASRKGKAVNASHSDVLTWPEGNGFLVKELSKNIQDKINPNSLVLSIKNKENGVEINYFDVTEKKIKSVEALQCLIAVPQFIAARLLSDEARAEKVKTNLHYTPWMVANMTVTSLEERSGAPLSWDNVLYGSSSLGYVEASHELLNQHQPKKNLTYYLPLTSHSPSEERKIAQEKTYEDWVNQIIQDLNVVHPNLEEAIEEINIMIWGHAMAQPLPGLVHGKIRTELSESVGNHIHFAHTDLAGASIFEEAFYQGMNAGNKIISKLTDHV